MSSSNTSAVGCSGRLLPHLDSRQVAELFAGSSAGAPRPRVKSKGPNHTAANIRYVREKSERNRLARLSQDGTTSDSRAATRPLACSNSTRPRSSGSTSSSSSDTLQACKPAAGRDFVRENAANAAKARKHGMNEQQAEQGRLEFHQPGQVPDYLIRRKMELAAQYAEQLAEKERTRIPAGMRYMTEAERLQALSKLNDLRLEEEREMQKLPFIAATVSQRRHKEQLEARVSELDDAIRVFSRPRVLVEVE